MEIINGYSAHADRGELTAWLDALKAKSPRLDKVMLVHGELPAQEALKTTLAAKGYAVDNPAPGTRISF